MDDETYTFAHRPRPFGHEVSYRLDPDGLFVDSGRKQTTIPYSAIEQVRLAYQPTNVGLQGFRARLRVRDGRSLTLGNLSWKSWVDVDRRDAAYRRFMKELLRRAGSANPQLVCISGQPVVMWGAVAVTGVLTCIALAAATILAAMRGSWPVALLSGLVLAGFAWQARLMVERNKPGVFTPDRLPQAVLPPA